MIFKKTNQSIRFRSMEFGGSKGVGSNKNNYLFVCLFVYKANNPLFFFYKSLEIKVIEPRSNIKKQERK